MLALPEHYNDIYRTFKRSPNNFSIYMMCRCFQEDQGRSKEENINKATDVDNVMQLHNTEWAWQISISDK